MNEASLKGKAIQCDYDPTQPEESEFGNFV